SRLPNNQWKLVIQLPLQYFITDLPYYFGFFWIKDTKLRIGASSRFFKNGKCADDFLGHLIARPADFKIVYGTLGLCSPILVCRYLHGTHCVFFYSKLHETNI